MLISVVLVWLLLWLKVRGRLSASVMCVGALVLGLRVVAGVLSAAWDLFMSDLLYDAVPTFVKDTVLYCAQGLVFVSWLFFAAFLVLVLRQLLERVSEA